MEEKLTAICLKSIDYKDNDKLVTLLSLQNGKVTAVAKGVKKASAKLKFACQTFCMSEYVLAEKAGKRTIIGASAIDSFYPVWQDAEKFTKACAAAELADVFAEENLPAPEFFLLLAELLKAYSYEKVQPSLLLLKFITQAVAVSGYAVSVFPSESARFSFEEGKISDSVQGIKVSYELSCLLYEMAELKMNQLCNKRAPETLIKEGLNLFNRYAEQKSGTALRAANLNMNIK